MSIFFSIIIPTYNRASLLKTTLQSLLKQTYKNFEILVVDDGGTDNTKDIVEEFGDVRIKYYWKENAERGAARNYGAKLAKGEYLNFFDSDDIAYENHLQTAANYILANPEVIAIHTSYDWKDPSLKPIQPSSIYVGILNEKIANKNILSCNNVFIRRKEFETLLFSEYRALSGSEDWLLWLRICCRYTVYGIKNVTSAIIQHDSRSMSLATSESTLKRTLAFADQIKTDEILVNKKTFYNSAMAEMYSLTSLYYAIDGYKKEALAYFLKAFNFSIAIFFRKRTFAILKYLFLK